MDDIDFDYDFDYDAVLDEDAPDRSTSGADMLQPESPADETASSHDVIEGPAAQDRIRFYPKRPHRKSRAGCKQCKKRKVKCDEAKPSCKACTLRKEKCLYPNAPPSAPSSSVVRSSPTKTEGPLTVQAQQQSDVEAVLTENAEHVIDTYEDEEVYRDIVPVISEPMFIPEQVTDLIDMKMLWFYTTHSFRAFSTNSASSPLINYALKVKVVEHAFRSPFLMETLKSLAAQHMTHLNQPVPVHKLIAYQAHSFRGYRGAIEKADRADFPALLACSFFTIALSSHNFRDPGGKRLFIVDWIAVWRGIGLIVEMITPQAVQDSGLAALLYRPPMDFEKTSQDIPNNLLFMVTTIKSGDPDYGYQKEYYEMLKYLGTLYHELREHGFGPVMDLRTIVFFSFTPRPLLALAQQFRPRILIIVAYWLCFVKLLGTPVWWMEGLSSQWEQIFEEVGDEWKHLLRVPQMVMRLDDKVEIARLIIDNHNWTPSELDLYRKHRDPRTKTDFKLINDQGTEIEISDGQWRLKTKDIKWDTPQVPSDPAAQSLLLGSSLLYRPMQFTNTTTAMPSTPPAIPLSPMLSMLSTPALSPSRSMSRSPPP